MNIDLMSVLIGILSSIVTAIAVFFTKRLAKKNLNQKVVTLKNSHGGTIEIVTGNDGEKNIRSHFRDAIEYERTVADILRNLNFEVEEASLKSPDKGYDLLAKLGERLIAVEVKSHSRPLSASVIKDTLNKFPTDIDDALFISKNGFSSSSLDYIQSFNKGIALASGENEELIKSIKSALESKGIKQAK
ncbi:restriction endonuclease [Photobacterium atrarenae]|uniref:Restriction endonuclease n=1 Tax=Photobacterium atrarenae TaxID=865757 RepID=A0ABY5GI50_9GAMM|nr:restriction endonuclease [Photobacterium atrarenae]UTV28957.1 restriction endonuclease [Photobacterium atrarenae]